MSRTIPAPAWEAPCALRTPAPSIPGDPATTATALSHLCASRRRAGRSRTTSASSTSPIWAAPGSTPISATCTWPASMRPSPCRRPGFQRGHGHRSAGPQRPPRGDAGVAIDARGDVDRQHGRRVADAGRVERAAKAGAVGGVDDEIGRRQGGRGVGRGDDADASAAGAEQVGRHPAVVAVVALAGDDDDAPPVGAAQEFERRPRHGAPGPRHEDRLVDVLERGGVRCPHLLDTQDRLHGPRGPGTRPAPPGPPPAPPPSPPAPRG